MLTVQEVSEKLRFSDQQVINWILAGKLKAYRFGGHYRIEESDMTEFMNNAIVRENKGE